MPDTIQLKSELPKRCAALLASAWDGIGIRERVRALLVLLARAMILYLNKLRCTRDKAKEATTPRTPTLSLFVHCRGVSI